MTVRFLFSNKQQRSAFPAQMFSVHCPIFVFLYTYVHQKAALLETELIKLFFCIHVRIRIRISFIRQVCANTRGICCGF